MMINFNLPKKRPFSSECIKIKTSYTSRRSHCQLYLCLIRAALDRLRMVQYLFPCSKVEHPCSLLTSHAPMFPCDFYNYMYINFSHGTLQILAGASLQSLLCEATTLLRQNHNISHTILQTEEHESFMENCDTCRTLCKVHQTHSMTTFFFRLS